MARHCAQCGAALGERGKFCHRCGASRDGSATAAPRPLGAGQTASTVLPWTVAGIALLCLLAFIVGQQWSRARTPVSAPVASDLATGPATGGATTGGRAPDISQLSPQERADRLFDRVMNYVDQGKSDSVMFFAPMAIASFEALAPLTLHHRYDLGLVGVVSGDGAMAVAQADTILREQPSHLLGLILAMRAAGLQGETAARQEFATRLTTALQTERAKMLPEYADHARDIDAAVREADGRSPLPN